MRTLVTTVSALLLGAAAAALAAGPAALLAPQASDLVPTALAVPTGKSTLLAPAGREPIALSWALPADEALDARPVPFASASREYWIEVSGAELAAGTEILTSAPGALVRLQPKAAAGSAGDLAIDPEELTVIDAKGKGYRASAAADRLVSAEQLAAAGAPVAEGTLALRLRPELGAGAFRLQVARAAAAARYLVHVFDRESALELRLQNARAEYLDGEALRVVAGMSDERGPAATEALDGFVVSPSGRIAPLRFRRVPSGAFEGRLALAAAAEPVGEGLWEVYASARGRWQGLATMRTVRGAFAVAVPTARLAGTAASVVSDGKGIAVTLGVESAIAGRYEVRGVLYGTAPDGASQPLAIAHAAAWLEAGPSSLELRFAPEALAGAKAGAPYELRDLRLVDQGRLGLLERRERALVLAP